MILRDVTLAGALSGLSAYVKQITLNYGAEAVPDTRMGHTTKVSEGGLFEWSGTIEFKQEYAAAVDGALFALIGTIGTFSAKPTSAATGATNPLFSGSALFTGYAPIQGQVGAQATTTLAFTSAGVLSRATA